MIYSTPSQAHADGRHGSDPFFAKSCFQCRSEWVNEMVSLLNDFEGERDLSNMTADEWEDAVEAHRMAKYELDNLRQGWGDEFFERMKRAAKMPNSIERMLGGK